MDERTVVLFNSGIIKDTSDHRIMGVYDFDMKVLYLSGQDKCFLVDVPSHAVEITKQHFGYIDKGSVSL